MAKKHKKRTKEITNNKIFEKLSNLDTANKQIFKKLLDHDVKFKEHDVKFEKIMKKLLDHDVKLEKILETKADKSDLDRYASAVDKYSKKADTYFQEMVALSHKVDIIEKWVLQIANETGVKLKV